MRTLLLATLLVGAALSSCGRGESIVEPGPGDPEDTTTTTVSPDDDAESDEVVTGGDDSDDSDDTDDSSTTQPPSTGDGTGASSVTSVVIDENSENAATYTELAASGLVLTLDEQACADTSAQAAVADGDDEVDAVIEAVQACASPRAIDTFASGLILAGGGPLPPTEAACVASRLRSTEEYRPFWVALLDEEPFDFLLAEREVQNRYLDLYAECVSVGRAVSEQANVVFSPPTLGCIDDLYNDREFVRITIEADLSGDPDERERIDGQISSCLTNDERSALASR